MFDYVHALVNEKGIHADAVDSAFLGSQFDLVADPWNYGSGKGDFFCPREVLGEDLKVHFSNPSVGRTPDGNIRLGRSLLGTGLSGIVGAALQKFDKHWNEALKLMESARIVPINE